MATLEKAEELLEQLREASYTAAKQDLEDVRAFAAEQGCVEPLQQASMCGFQVLMQYSCIACMPGRRCFVWMLSRRATTFCRQFVCNHCCPGWRSGT